MRTSRIDIIYYYNTKTAHTSNLKFRKAPPHVYKAPGAPMARELLAVMNPESTSSHVISYLRSTELKSVFLRLAIFPFRQLVPDGVFCWYPSFLVDAIAQMMLSDPFLRRRSKILGASLDFLMPDPTKLQRTFVLAFCNLSD